MVSSPTGILPHLYFLMLAGYSICKIKLMAHAQVIPSLIQTGGFGSTQFEHQGSC